MNKIIFLSLLILFFFLFAVLIDVINSDWFLIVPTSTLSVSSSQNNLNSVSIKDSKNDNIITDGIKKIFQTKKKRRGLDLKWLEKEEINLKKRKKKTI